jgi:hypothetical protein
MDEMFDDADTLSPLAVAGPSGKWSVNPMVVSNGLGPIGATCSSCTFYLADTRYGGRIHGCAKYYNPRRSGESQHYGFWPVCALFAPRSEAPA